MIDTPQKIQRPILSVPHQVTGSIETSTGFLAERIGNELLSRQARSVHIPSSQPYAPEAQLTCHTHRKRSQIRIEDVHLRVPDGWPNRRRL